MAQLKESTLQGNLDIDGNISASNAAFDNLSVNGVVAVDYVVEQGTSGIWTYRKWNSGIAECWGKSAVYTVSVSGSWGSVFTCDNAIPSYQYPITFIEYPTVIITPETSGNNFWIFTGSGGTVNQTPGVSVCRPNNNSVSASANFYIKGRWK